MSDRRTFLKHGIATGLAATGSTFAAGESLDEAVEAEMASRLKFLASPQGTPSFGSVLSPMVLPFQTPFFRPCVAQPLFSFEPAEYPFQFVASTSPSTPTGDHGLRAIALAPVDIQRVQSRLTTRQLQQTSELDLAWLAGFWKRFVETAESLGRISIDLGDLPDPFAHQRFFDFKPVNFYAMWEVEFAWQFHEQYLDDSYNWGFATFCDHGGDKESHGNYGHYGDCTFLPLQRSSRWQRPATGRLSEQQLHLEASSPGPTYRVRYEEPVMVRRINALPEILNDSANRPKRRRIKFALPSTTTHLHNAHTASESDGHPNDWINPGEYWDHHYGNFPSGYDPNEKLSTLWYHDHRMDFTASNVYAGLDGFYTIYDEKTDDRGHDLPPEQLQDIGTEGAGWGFPAGDYDVPMILHDLLFAMPNGERLPPAESVEYADGKAYDQSPQLVFDGFNTDGILGDRMTVNRIIQPVMHVEPRKYRFRILNGGPSRFYELVLHSETNPQDEPSDLVGEIPLIVIAGDGNFQPSPLLARSLYMGVAQRNDFIIDFSEFEGQSLYLCNVLDQPHGQGPSGREFQRDTYSHDRYDSNTDSHGTEWFFRDLGLVKFVVDEPLKSPDASTMPLMLRSFPPVDLTEVRRERLWEFDFDGGLWTINGMTYDPNRIDAGIEQDTAEIWTLRNVGNSWSHPIHSHFTEFIVLEINGVPQYQYAAQESEVLQRTKYFAPRQNYLPMQGIERQQFLDLFRSAGLRWQAQGAEMKKLQAEGKESAMMRLLDEGEREPRNELEAQRQFNERVKNIHNEVRIREIASAFAVTIVEKFASEQLRTDLDRFLNGTLGFEQVRMHSAQDFRVIVVLLEILGIASLDLRGNQDVVKGDGRFMGGPRRDVALLLPDWEVTVFMRWKDFLGKHVMHCHNVVHEDHAMMIRWDIVPPGHGFDTPKRADRFYAQEPLSQPHVQPNPEHSSAHENDSDGPLSR